MTHAYAHVHFSNKRVIRELRIVSCPGGGVWVAVTREFECDNCVISEILQSDWTIPNRAGVPRKSTKVPRPSFVRESREGLGPRLLYNMPCTMCSNTTSAFWFVSTPPSFYCRTLVGSLPLANNGQHSASIVYASRDLFGCPKQNDGFYLRCTRKTLAQSLQASITQDTDTSRHRRHRPTGEGASRRPYIRGGTRASRAYRPTSLPRFALIGFSIQQLAESVQR